MTRNLPAPIVRTDDLAELGPAMRALPNDAWRVFVSALVQTGCTAQRAAHLAGFAPHRNGLGARMTQDPRVQAALHEEAVKVLRVDGVVCIRYLREIAGDKEAAHRDRLKAIDMILSRGGFAATTQHNVVVSQKSDEQLKAELAAMADELGLTGEAKAKLIGGRVIDAEFTEVASLPETAEAPRPTKPQLSRRQRVREAKPDEWIYEPPDFNPETEGTEDATD